MYSPPKKNKTKQNKTVGEFKTHEASLSQEKQTMHFIVR